MSEHIFPKVYNYTEGDGAEGSDGSGSGSGDCNPPADASKCEVCQDGQVVTLPKQSCTVQYYPTETSHFQPCYEGNDNGGRIVMKPCPEVTVPVLPKYQGGVKIKIGGTEYDYEYRPGDRGYYYTQPGLGTPFPPGTYDDTHYIDRSAKRCAQDGPFPCPVLPLPANKTKTINVPKGSTQSTSSTENIIKTGEGTLVITNPNPSIDSGIKNLFIDNGRVIIHDNATATNTGNNPTSILNSSSVISLHRERTDNIVGVGELILPSNRDTIVKNISFGYISKTSSTGTYSYTSTSLEYDYYGRVVLNGQSKLTITDPSNELKTHFKDLMIMGRNKGSWDGASGFNTTFSTNGIKSLGYRFLNDGSIAIRWAIPGDITLDGRVNSTDITLINNAGKYGQQLTGAHWHEGDFNYDGIVNSTDITLINNSIGVLGSAFGNFYLPQNVSFNVSWNPNVEKISGPNQVLISTSDTEKPLPYRAYEPEFTSNGIKYNQICEITDQITCSQFVNSYWNSEAKSCYDSACSQQKLEIVQSSPAPITKILT